jgi:hypothetical protein
VKEAAAAIEEWCKNKLLQQLWSLRNIDRDPPRFIFVE